MRNEIRLFLFVLLSFALLFAGCGDSSESDCETPDGDADPPDGDTENSGDDEANAFAPPAAWTVHVSKDAPEAVRIAAEDAKSYLAAMGFEAVLEVSAGPESCVDGAGHAVFSNTLLADEGDTDQTFAISETRCEGGALVTLSGGGLLGRQYAAYDWLRRLGVRFFHPEEEYVPDAPAWPESPLDVRRTPPFKWRSVSLHLTHPLELGDAFEFKKEEYLEEGRRYIDWQIKNLASNGKGGVGNGDLSDYGHRRGFPTSAGVSLYGQQQGADGLLDPLDEDWQPKVETALLERLGEDPTQAPDFFSFSFNPTEFTEVDDRKAVEQMTFIADFMAEHYPSVQLMTTNHGTYGDPTDFYGVRYYDLPKFAPANLGVKVHTLMFYDLFRPAPMYGNENFNFAYDFMAGEYRTRKLWHFPESAWWLTFDIAVPWYLPITIEARHRDIQAIAFMLDGGLEGHHVFGSGHEWGYWQNEYCSFRMAADLSVTWKNCLADITGTMGAAAPEVQAVLEYLVELQERDFIYGDILAYLVGSDSETEAAESLGIRFHPLPPSPKKILTWSAAECKDWDRRIAPALERMDDDYATLLARLADVKTLVPENARPWFDEIVDGIEATGLRARHQREVYGALVTFRQSRLEASADLETAAWEWLDKAQTATTDYLAVAHRREEGYRYRPLERSIAGGADGTEDDNWTSYSYRYLNRAHHGFYYTRIDRLAEEAMSARGASVVATDTLLTPGDSLVVDAVDTELSNVSYVFGDGENAAGNHAEHTYAAPGVYAVQVTADKSGQPFAFSGDVAVVETEYLTGFSGKVVEPAGVSIIEPVLPACAFGKTDPSGTAVAISFSGFSDGRADFGGFSMLENGETESLFETQPVTLNVPIVKHSDGSVTSSIVVENARLVMETETEPVRLTGLLQTEAVIQAVIVVGNGAFDERNARELVASFLGYPVEELPERVPFVVEYDLKTEDADER